LSVIASGGMAVVYMARNKAVGSTVAIKMLKNEFVADDELFARFCNEAQAVQKLADPHIVTVHEFGMTADRQPFIVMDYLQGLTLSQLIETNERLPVKR